MGVKRKFGTLEDTQTGNIVAKPPPGTRTFASGKAVLDGLAAGSAQGNEISVLLFCVKLIVHLFSPCRIPSTDTHRPLSPSSSHHSSNGTHPAKLPRCFSYPR